MPTENTKLEGKDIGFSALKALGFFAIYAILHFIWDWLPYIPFAIIGATDESMFQHIKIGFYSLVFYCLIEFLITMKKIENKQSFWFGRLFTIILIPWLNVILWQSIPVFTEIHGIVELIYSIIIVYLTGFIAILLNYNLENIEYNIASKIILVVLVVISVFIFTAYTFIEPWYSKFYTENLPPYG